MTAIVMNTQTGAVSEYSWSFPAISPNYAASDAGLLLLGGDKDAGAKIAASFATGKTLCGTSVKKAVDTAYPAVQGPAGSRGMFTVFGKSASWSYPVVVGEPGESRVKPGRGIRETYLGFGYSNVDGADFFMDQMEVNVIASEQRRTSS